MKRYLLFSGRNYYPSGGFEDFNDSFDDEGAAVEAMNQTSTRDIWAHVVDLESGEIIHHE